MTISKATTVTERAGKLARFPDFPPRDDMQNWFHLHESAIGSALSIHFRDRLNASVASEVPVTPSQPRGSDVRIPDLLVAFDCDLALVREQNGYVIDRQGKAPDFVLEVASHSTGEVDYTDKRADYERFGILEYWRFDPSGGEYHDVALAGDRLMDGAYEPITVDMVEDGHLRGHSEALGLYVCWEDGMLRFYDPSTEGYLLAHEEERAGRIDAEFRAETAEVRAEEERAGRMTAETRTEEERAGRVAAESRLVELESELRRLRGE